MKISTKDNENLELNSDSIYVKGIGGYDGNNAGQSGVMSLSNSIPKIIDVTDMIDSPLTGDVSNAIQYSPFIVYNGHYYPSVAFSDVSSFVDIHEHISASMGDNATMIQALFGYCTYSFDSGQNKYNVDGVDILVLYFDQNSRHTILTMIEM